MTKKKDKKATPFEEKVLEYYVDNGCVDKSAAYLACHESADKWKSATVHKRASELFKKEHCKERLEELQAAARKHAERRLEINGTVVLNEWAKIGFSDIREILNDDLTLKPKNLWPEHVAASIAGIETKIGKDGGEIIKIKLWSKPTALEALSKNLGLFFRDNAQKKSVHEMSDEELQEELLLLRKEAALQGKQGKNE